jgi:hypothetical protein
MTIQLTPHAEQVLRELLASQPDWRAENRFYLALSGVSHVHWYPNPASNGT